MIEIKVEKIELENFIDKIKKDFNLQLISFEDFKFVFCNDKIDFTEDNMKDTYLKLYDNISNGSNEFYRKIRKFIIEKFIEKIKFCPYCWKVPLIYFKKWDKKNDSYKRMFQFDHFFPKNIFHKWIINFYNLIPSCNACNHLKWDKNPLNAKEVFHPYFGFINSAGQQRASALWNNLDDNFSFINSIDHSIWNENTFKYNDKKELIFNSDHSKFFKLWEIYLHSQDTFNIFNFIQDKRTKIKNELNNFKVDITKLKDKNEKEYKLEKYKNYFFKNFYPKKEEDILTFANWKLKKDLIESFEI